MATRPVLPAIQGVVSSATAGFGLANAVLVILQGIPFDAKGPDDVKFVFDYREEDSEDLTSDITDHFTEANISVQDQIARRPVRATLHGFKGELSDSKEGIAAEIALIASQLTAFAPYAPALTAAALQAYNQAQQLYNVAASAVATISQAFHFLSGEESPNKQQQAFRYFKKHWENASLFTVQTPWESLENMAIESLHAIQGAESNTISDFKITFKQMNFASTLASTSTIQGQGRYTAQVAASSPETHNFQNPVATAAPNFGGANPGAFQ